ncbi:MAG: ATP-dependent RNA helicase [Rhodobacteraceae bacterium]|nr:MAG: ATP-dependent RNA helicase [Paracoccaceae bacterium]
MTEFEGVVPTLAQALNKRGYETLTPVQLAMLDPDLDGVDALVSAQTGSGKTVAFGLAIAPTLMGKKDKMGYAAVPAALVIAPTRELALQVKRELEWLYREAGASIASCVGGMDMRTERRALEGGAHIVVGTPGRLRDHIERRSLNLEGLKAVVLDEADEMLDLGFRDELEFILGASPDDRRTLMFSATVPRSIANLASRYQRDAVRVAVASEQKQHSDIEYRGLVVQPSDTENAIINVLRFYEAKNAIVFCNTRATVNHMTARFNNRGFSVVALSGELSQNERTHALQAMRDGRARVCIATDVAARGIDLPNLELVIHADLPKNKESLLHRSGRTGRAGRKGVSVLIVPFRARNRTERLLKNANVTATWDSPPSAEAVLKRDNERFLSDPALSETLTEAEAGFAQDLLAQHSPEQIAGALVRMYRAGRSAPEELRPASERTERGEREERSHNRKGFGDSVWFSISIGFKQKAEARWMLPMLVKHGKLKKHEIGAIKVLPSVTYIEVASGGANRFVEAISPSMKLEKTMTVTKLDGVPQMIAEARAQEPDGKKPYKSRKPKPPHRGKGPKKPYDGKSGAPASQRKKPKKPKKPKS